jgi:DNA anti-recombination protein RmuC
LPLMMVRLYREKLLNFAELPSHTQFFLGFVTFLTLYFHVKYDEKTLTYGPTILTTTGIFATFLGIALGLADFDTTNIQASVPALLAGLKTAFWASVAGVGGALTIKFRHFFIGVKQEVAGSGVEGEITAADLAKLLQSIQQALVGSDDSTLVSQLKLSRQDTNDRLDALKKAQQEALLKLSEMGSKALVEALRDVIKDFNAKLTEQFGDNFKQLNEAVGRLLVWQDQYKAHIEAMTERHTDIIGSMKVASDNYQKLVTEAARFTAISADLAELLTGLETQKQQLTGMLESLADLLKAASGSLPEVEKKVMELTEQLTRSVEINQKEVSKALAENVQLIRTSIQNVGQDFSKINQDFNKHLGDMAEKTNKQVSALDAALAEELTKSLESLGRQMAALSEKFVSDYSPLADKLRAIVNMARQ